MRQSPVHGLLRRVAARRRLVDLGARCHRFLLVLAAAYALLLLASRLGGLIPEWSAPWTLLAIPALAFVLAALVTPKLSDRGAARSIDTRMNTDDLFLTAVVLDESPGEYKPLVLRDAEERVARIEAAEVVRIRLWPKTRDACAALAVLLLGVLVLPRLDPFGRAQERESFAERRRRLEDGAKATALRSSILKEKSAGPESEEVGRALEELKKTFGSMKPGRKKANLNRLGLMQKELGSLWRKTSEKRLADALRRSSLSQRFGSVDDKLTSRWKKDLAGGEADGLRKELARLKDKARRLAESTDPAERERLRNEIRRGLRRMADFAECSANSRELAAALSRAMEQLGLAGLSGTLSRDALRALESTLDLTALEVAAIAKQLRELQRLEDALEAARLARSLCEAGNCPGGAACAQCGSIAEYAALYRRLLEQMDGRGAGPGMKGPGLGRGGEAPEDPDAETDFKPELSRSDVTAGKMLLEWKTKGLSDPGRARQDYRRAVRQVKQGWSEAVLREQVPPGYHTAIRKYFDSLDEERAGETRE